MGKKKPRTSIAPRCPVPKCKNCLDNPYQCKQCGLNVCHEHQYHHDHAEVAPKLAEKSSEPMPVPKPSSELEVVKKLAAAAPKPLNSALAGFAEKSPEELIRNALAASDSRTCLLALAFGCDSSGVRAQAVLSSQACACAADSGEAKQLFALAQNHFRSYLPLAARGALAVECDRACGGFAVLLGELAAAHPELAPEARTTLLEAAQRFHSTRVQNSAAEGLRLAVSAARRNDGSGNSEDEQLVTELLKKIGSPDCTAEERRGTAAALAGLCAGIGSHSLDGPVDDGQQLAVAAQLSKLLEVRGKTKSEAARCGVLMGYEMMGRTLKRRFVPYMVKCDVVRTCHELFANGDKETRKIAKSAALACIAKLGAHGVRVCIPGLLVHLEDPRWRMKELALLCIAALASKGAKLPTLGSFLPLLVPLVMDLVHDSKKQVAAAASSALEALPCSITNAETLNLMPYLLKAVREPKTVHSCLEELLDTTFANSVDANSLAFFIPIVVRGMREGNAEVIRAAASTAGNLCSLVNDVSDLLPFVPQLLPELEKALEHSQPLVRECAERAKASLTRETNGVGGADDGTKGDMTPRDREGASKAVERALALVTFLSTHAMPSPVPHETAFGKMCMEPTKVGPTTKEFVRDAARAVLDELCASVGRSRVMRSKVESQLDDMVAPLLIEYLDRDAIGELCAFAASKLVSVRRSDSLIDESGAGSILVRCEDVILAFPSRTLLQRTHLTLKTGKCYAIVGQNGVGKTTLLDRVAKKDIAGFPKGVSVFYVKHEINSEDREMNCREYLARQFKSRVKSFEDANARAKGALDHFQFTPQMQGEPIAALSGGWRMRLAIAGSMLFAPQLLLLDEPTNHLDAESVQWLADYLNDLCKSKHTTIVIVSHDYDFVSLVATNITHIADLKLTYYECGFKEFQTLRPDVCAALPKAEKRVDEDGDGCNVGDANALMTALERLEIAKESGQWCCRKLELNCSEGLLHISSTLSTNIHY